MLVSTYAGVYDAYQFHEPYIRATVIAVRCLACITNALLALTTYIIHKNSAVLHKTYRTILLCNIYLPAILSNYAGFVFQPYIVFPYPIIANYGLITGHYLSTAIQILIGLSIALPFVFSLLYTGWFYYLALCQSVKIAYDPRKQYIVLGTATTFLVVNLVLMSLSADANQQVKQEFVKAISPQLRVFMDTYSGYVVNYEELPWPVYPLGSLIAFELALITIVAPLTLRRIVYSMYRNRHIISTSTYRQQKMILLVMIMYVLIYIGLYGCPTTMVSTLLLLGWDVSRLPVCMIMAIAVVLPSSTFSLMYLIVIKPYRKALMNMLGLNRFLKSRTTENVTTNIQTITVVNP